MSRAQITTDAAIAAREEILQAAAELFTDLGYAMTSIDAIAERLGATKGRVYYYFKSKADIFFDIQRAAMSRLMAEIEPIARSDLSPPDKLRAMARSHLGMLLADLPIQKVSVQGLERYLFHASGYRYMHELREINQLRDTYEQIFAEVIDQGAREGFFSDMPARLLTKPFFGALNWVTVWYRPRKIQDAESNRMIVETLVSFAMQGIQKDHIENGPSST